MPGIGTADYEIVQVDHDVDALASLLEGARVVCNTRRPVHLPRLDGGRGRAEGGLPLHRHGRRDAVGEARERGMGREVRGRGLLLAPATAYMSAVAEACARIAIERAPGIDSLEILIDVHGLPDLRVDPDASSASSSGSRSTSSRTSTGSGRR